MKPFLYDKNSNRSIVFPNIEDAGSFESLYVIAKIHFVFDLEIVFVIEFVLIHALEEACFISWKGAGKVSADSS